MLEQAPRQDLGDEQPHEPAVELGAGDAAQLVLGLGGAERRAVGVGRGQRRRRPRRWRGCARPSGCRRPTGRRGSPARRCARGGRARRWRPRRGPRRAAAGARRRRGGARAAGAPPRCSVVRPISTWSGSASLPMSCSRPAVCTTACSRSDRPAARASSMRVVRDGGGVAGGARVAQRQRLQQQAEHALVADVELVAAALDLLLVTPGPRARPAAAAGRRRGEREQADDAGAVDLEAVDGHRGQRRGGELPRQHRQVDRAEHLQQRAAAEQHRVPGDHREVEDVGRDEHARTRRRAKPPPSANGAAVGATPARARRAAGRSRR